MTPADRLRGAIISVLSELETQAEDGFAKIPDVPVVRVTEEFAESVLVAIEGRPWRVEGRLTITEEIFIDDDELTQMLEGDE